jgi:hypothetical protein
MNTFSFNFATPIFLVVSGVMIYYGLVTWPCVLLILLSHVSLTVTFNR